MLEVLREWKKEIKGYVRVQRIIDSKSITGSQHLCLWVETGAPARTLPLCQGTPERRDPDSSRQSWSLVPDTTSLQRCTEQVMPRKDRGLRVRLHTGEEKTHRGRPERWRPSDEGTPPPSAACSGEVGRVISRLQESSLTCPGAQEKSHRGGGFKPHCSWNRRKLIFKPQAPTNQ